MPQSPITEISLKIPCIKLYWYLPGVNELKQISNKLPEMQWFLALLHYQWSYVDLLCTNTFKFLFAEGRGDLEQIQSDITDAEIRVQNIYQVGSSTYNPWIMCMVLFGKPIMA